MVGSHLSRILHVCCVGGHVEESSGSRCEGPFVKIGRVIVHLEAVHVNVYVPHCVRAIHKHSLHAMASKQGYDVGEREYEGGHGGDVIYNRQWNQWTGLFWL